MKGRRHTVGSPAGAAAGSLVVHAVAGAFLLAASAERATPPPTYAVRLVAAPLAEIEPRKAPEAVQRPAEPKPVPTDDRRPKSTVSRSAPPPEADVTKREAAPRATPEVQPLPGERPSTGTDVATVSTEGIEFPYPEYLQNLVSEVMRRWQRPVGPAPLEAEMSFLVHRDGSIGDLRFVRRSGSFGFDLEVQGALEEAGRSKAFGPLPEAWPADVLFVRFFFSPRRP